MQFINRRFTRPRGEGGSGRLLSTCLFRAAGRKRRERERIVFPPPTTLGNERQTLHLSAYLHHTRHHARPSSPSFLIKCPVVEPPVHRRRRFCFLASERLHALHEIFGRQRERCETNESTLSLCITRRTAVLCGSHWPVLPTILHTQRQASARCLLLPGAVVRRVTTTIWRQPQI